MENKEQCPQGAPCSHEHQPAADPAAPASEPVQKPPQEPASPPPVVETSKLTDFFFRLEAYMKLYFLLTSLMGWRDATFVGFFASVLGLLRTAKRPQFNQEYLKKFLTNQFGLNIVYFLMLAAQQGPRTYLFYAPIALHYFLGIVEFVNLKHKDRLASLGLAEWVQAIRDNRHAILVYKGKLEFMYEMLLLFCLPFNLGLILSVVMLGQYLLLKHKTSTEFKWSMHDINDVLRRILGPIPIVNFIYEKVCLGLSKM